MWHKDLPIVQVPFVFCPLYTTQLMVEPSSLLILSYEVFSQNHDAGTLPPMADKTQAVLGHHLSVIIADKAYATLLDLRACDERGIELIAGSEKAEKAEKAEKDHELPKQKKNQKRSKSPHCLRRHALGD